MNCPKCKDSAGFVDYRCKKVVGLVGDMRLSRPYYHCEHCHTGIWPWDEVLRLSPERLTPGAQEVVALQGVLGSFAKAADRALEKCAGLRLSESTVERATEAAGERVGTCLAEGEVFGTGEAWKWHRDAEGKTCAYVSIDATGIMMQGPDGAKADGQMVNLGMVFNPQPRAPEDKELSKPCDGVRYLAGHYSLAELGEQLRRQAGQVGMNDAEVWIGLSDAGNGLEHFFDAQFPKAVKIVDFRHASEYVNEFAKAYRPGSEGDALAETWCHQLKHEGGAALLAVVKGLDRRKMSKGAREKYDALLSYLTNHHARMDYPTYLRKGWQIATGAVESACKTVVNQRLNMGGMRWGEEGSDGVCHLRALFMSDPDQWDAFWYRPRKSRAKTAA